MTAGDPPDCDRCGWRMVPLFTSHACPQGCDRIERGHCPGCDGTKIEAFDGTWLKRAVHCVDCGRVWSAPEPKGTA